jgi:hypothetical protein
LRYGQNLRRRGSAYAFRFVVPTRFVSCLVTREIVLALKTTDYRIAIGRARVLRSSAESLTSDLDGIRAEGIGGNEGGGREFRGHGTLQVWMTVRILSHRDINTNCLIMHIAHAIMHGCSRIPDWRLFQAFLAVVREGSLSSAARAWNDTAHMGRQVAALEASLGVKLFTRWLDDLSPTDAGLPGLSRRKSERAFDEDPSVKSVRASGHSLRRRDQLRCQIFNCEAYDASGEERRCRRYQRHRG